MIRYQGESIDFSIECDRKSITWRDFTKVVIYFYTHTSRIAKFLYTTTTESVAVASETEADTETESTTTAESTTAVAKTISNDSAVTTSDTSDYIVINPKYKRFLTGTIPAEYTKTMSGALLFDIVAFNGDTEQYHIKAKPTGIQINYSPIKQEI